MAVANRAVPAKRDLLEIWLYVADADIAAADRLINSIEHSFLMLAEHPAAGAQRDDLGPGIRFYPVGNFLIFYEPFEDGIMILRVLHGARQYSDEF